MSQPNSIRDILRHNSPVSIQGSRNNVNVNINSNNVNVSKKDKLIEQLIDECGGEASAVAHTIAEKLNDDRSLNYYLKMTRLYPFYVLFESLAETLEASKDGRIKSTSPKYFVGILKKKAHKLKKETSYEK